ncbi:MAG: hypothetical protein K9G49_05770 [Taibaiella sp.]|nr:hypothetical protein [Taibaiella sp.]
MHEGHKGVLPVRRRGAKYCLYSYAIFKVAKVLVGGFLTADLPAADRDAEAQRIVNNRKLSLRAQSIA